LPFKGFLKSFPCIYTSKEIPPPRIKPCNYWYYWDPEAKKIKGSKVALRVSEIALKVASVALFYLKIAGF